MYSKTLMEKIKKVVKTWTGKEGELDSLPIHELINALDQVKCDVANGLKSSDPLIPLMIQNVLNKKLFELATNIQNYPLNNKEKIVQVYLLVRPKIAYNMNKLFVVCERNVKRTKFNNGILLILQFSPLTKILSFPPTSHNIILSASNGLISSAISNKDSVGTKGSSLISS